MYLGWNDHITKAGKQVVQIRDSFEYLDFLFGNTWQSISDQWGTFKFSVRKGVKFIYDEKYQRLIITLYYQRENLFNLSEFMEVCKCA